MTAPILPRHADGKIDRRYAIAREYCGYKAPQWVARFCGDWLGCAPNRPAAIAAARAHQVARHHALGIAPPSAIHTSKRKPL